MTKTIKPSVRGFTLNYTNSLLINFEHLVNINERMSVQMFLFIWMLNKVVEMFDLLISWLEMVTDQELSGARLFSCIFVSFDTAW